MRNEGRAILSRLLPTLLVLGSCGGSKPLGSTTGSGGGSAGAAAATGSAGSTGSGGTSGVDVGGAGATGSGAGTTGTAGDTVTGSAGATGTAGAADGSSPDDGAGQNAPPDAEVTTEGGTGLPPYDGGIVSSINSSNWNETTIHPFSTRRMLVRDVGDPHLVLLDFSRTDPVVWRTAAGGPWARSIQLIGNNQVMGGSDVGYQVFDLTSGQIVKTVIGHGGTQSAYRTANGETMLTRSGTTLDFLDKSDRVAHSISYPGFPYVRLARPTRNGTYLVPSDTKVFEGDAKGNVLWTATSAAWSHAWEPLLMSDGNVLLATGYGMSLDVLDKTTHLVVKRYGTRTIPMAAQIMPNYFTEFQILPNGNLITSNTMGLHGCPGFQGIQVIEFNPAGEVVWYYKQDPKVFCAIEGVMVIDGMDPRFLHVQEISPDSTWQPVIPTP